MFMTSCEVVLGNGKFVLYSGLQTLKEHLNLVAEYDLKVSFAKSCIYECHRKMWSKIYPLILLIKPVLLIFRVSPVISDVINRTVVHTFTTLLAGDWLSWAVRSWIFFFPLCKSKEKWWYSVYMASLNCFKTSPVFSYKCTII